MTRSRFTDSQLVAVLKQAEVGTAVPDSRARYISTATSYKWPSKYGGMNVSLMTRMGVLRRRTVDSIDSIRGADWSSPHFDRTVLS
jgi:putative transposase